MSNQEDTDTNTDTGNTEGTENSEEQDPYEWVPGRLEWEAGPQLAFPENNPEPTELEFGVTFVERTYPENPIRIRVSYVNSGTENYTLTTDNLFEFAESESGRYQLVPREVVEEQNQLMFDEEKGVWRASDPISNTSGSETIQVTGGGFRSSELVVVYIGDEIGPNVVGLQDPQIFSTDIEFDSPEEPVTYQFALHYQE